MTVDELDIPKLLSPHEGLMRYSGGNIRAETYGNWTTYFLECEFHLRIVDRWIPTLVRIGIKHTINTRT